MSETPLKVSYQPVISTEPLPLKTQITPNNRGSRVKFAREEKLGKVIVGDGEGGG